MRAERASSSTHSFNLICFSPFSSSRPFQPRIRLSCEMSISESALSLTPTCGVRNERPGARNFSIMEMTSASEAPVMLRSCAERDGMACFAVIGAFFGQRLEHLCDDLLAALAHLLADLVVGFVGVAGKRLRHSADGFVTAQVNRLAGVDGCMRGSLVHSTRPTSASARVAGWATGPGCRPRR